MKNTTTINYENKKKNINSTNSSYNNNHRTALAKLITALSLTNKSMEDIINDRSR